MGIKTTDPFQDLVISLHDFTAVVKMEWHYYGHCSKSTHNLIFPEASEHSGIQQDANEDHKLAIKLDFISVFAH